VKLASVRAQRDTWQGLVPVGLLHRSLSMPTPRQDSKKAKPNPSALKARARSASDRRNQPCGKKVAKGVSRSMSTLKVRCNPRCPRELAFHMHWPSAEQTPCKWPCKRSSAGLHSRTVNLSVARSVRQHTSSQSRCGHDDASALLHPCFTAHVRAATRPVSDRLRARCRSRSTAAATATST
jgi:hypothetical protein